ncbi:DNA polymerase beta superfamily protein [Rhizobium phaseoli]|uniref:DNA polymerase beta superfamily protein n=1 Tax=Rhizobium phaseoli TaxID=396 RepID=UPI00247A4929|nr:nucleotidyltransferase domain-containing protein [Rhizobium phaseoli]
MRQHFQSEGEGSIKLKKLLYAVRPAIALEWMRQRSFQALPPMNMLECLEAISIASDLRTAILDLVQVKKQMREMGEGLPPMRGAIFSQQRVPALFGDVVGVQPGPRRRSARATPC